MSKPIYRTSVANIRAVANGEVSHFWRSDKPGTGDDISLCDENQVRELVEAARNTVSRIDTTDDDGFVIHVPFVERLKRALDPFEQQS